MSGRIEKPWIAFSGALLLAGCALTKPAVAPAVDPNIFPSSYRADMLSFLQVWLIDPTGIREAGVIPPTLKPFDTQDRYVVCVRYDARDGDRKYLGVTEKAAIYFGAKINQFVDATPALCGGTPYQPFPELAALKRVNN
jgi:hypothetical protein